MKKTLYLIIIISLTAACFSCKRANDLPFIDVRENFAEKEIILTDIADITYSCLDSDDENYLFAGSINCITENTIVIIDNVSSSILFFSKDGKPKSRFNRTGRGPEEYLEARQVVYDEASDDVFVVSFGHNNVLYVYSSMGDYKRKIILPEGTYIQAFCVFDNESLFVYDASVERRKFFPLDGDDKTAFFESHLVRISKSDGEVLNNVELPNNEIALRDRSTGGPFAGTPFATCRLIKSKEGVLLCNPETDTVFFYSKNLSLTPVIYKTPSVKSLDPMVILNNCADAGRYQFMDIVTIDAQERFPVKHIMRDKKTGEIYLQKFVLPDYKGKDFIFNQRQHRNYDGGIYFELDLAELKEAYKEGRLNGRLKELVATLNEDKDNNVSMLVDFK